MFEGVILSDRYRLEVLVGHGAMGEVWRATDQALNRAVAVKLLRPAGDDTAETNRMVREARSAAQIHHVNTVAVYDLQVTGPRPFVVMEFVDGESLADRLRREGRLDVDAAADLAAQVARGLQAVHAAGIVHRDIKPANILITRDGVAKLADFGIARGAADTQLTQTGQMMGTVTFMAPEVARGGPATIASDIWSLGATLYAAVEGFAPFGADVHANATSVLIRLISEPAPAATRAGRLTPLLAEMLDQTPQRRPSLNDVLQQLEPAVAPDVIESSEPPTITRDSLLAAPPPPRPHSRHGRARTRRRGVLAALAAVVALGAGATAWAVASGGSSGHPGANSPAASTGSPSVPSTNPATQTTSTPRSPAPRTSSVANADPHKVVDTFDLHTGSANYFDAAVTNDGKNVYSVGFNDAGDDLPVIVVNVATKQRSTIPLTGTVGELLMEPDRPVAYVSEFDSAHKLKDVAVISTDTATVTSRIALPQQGKLTDLGNVGELAASADGKYLFVTEPHSVAMVATSTGTVVKYLEVRNGLGSIAASANGSRIYVVSMYEQSLDVINTDTGARLATRKFAIFNNGVPTKGVVMSPDGKTVYAYGENDGDESTPDTLGILDTATNTMHKRSIPSALATFLAVSPSGRYLYLDGIYFKTSGGLSANSLNILDLRTFKIRKVPLAAGPYAISVSRDGRRVYVDTGPGHVAVIA